MTETGVVFKLDEKNNTAAVRFERRAECGKCGMCLAHKKDMYVYCTVKNTRGAAVGDTVKIELSGKSAVFSALIVYAVPVILLIAALAATINAGIGAQIGASLGAIALGAGIAVFADAKLKKRKGFAAEMTEIIK